MDAYRELLQKIESNHQQVPVDETGEKFSVASTEDTPRKKQPASADVVDTLSNLGAFVTDALAAFSRQAVEFRKRVKEEEEVFQREMQLKRDTWHHEEEEYQYTVKVKRRQEEDDYILKTREKERSFNESIVAKKQELEEREKLVKIQEDEIKGFKKQIELFPVELKKAIEETEKRTRFETEREAKVVADLISKDMQREQELAKLTIQGLEDTIKRQTVQIGNLERQLSQAIERVQKLAVTVIEGGRKQYDEEKKDEKTSLSAG